MKEAERKNPRIKVFNVEERNICDEDTFIQRIIIQNRISIETDKSIIKVVYKHKNKKGKINVVLEIDQKTYTQIKLKNTINIHWQTCKYVEHINVIQCYRCWKFGHMAKLCNNKNNTCPKCTGDHKEIDCKAQTLQCVNCKYVSQVLRVPNVKYDHEAFNRKDCESYKRISNKLHEKFNYLDISNGRNI